MIQQPHRLVAGTTPYPWPFDQGLARHRLALLVCGAGEARVAPIAEDLEVEDNIGRLREAAASIGVPVFLLDHDLNVRRTPGLGNGNGRWSQPLSPNGAEQVVHAAGVDAFYGSALDPVLRSARIDELILIGRGFETTVHSTLRTANDAGYECLTVSDACLAIDERCRSAAISTIEMSGGIFGAVGLTAAVVNALHELPTHLPPLSPQAGTP